MSNPKHSMRAELLRDGILAEFSEEIMSKGFGEVIDNKIWLFPEEALFLLENGKIRIFEGGEEISREEFVEKMEKRREGFFLRYLVYRDLRKRGYVVKAGTKYGADFRVYEKGIKPKKGERGEEEHSKFLVLVLGDDDKIAIKVLVGLNRVAHSVRKRLLLAIVDRDLGITYLQINRIPL